MREVIVRLISWVFPNAFEAAFTFVVHQANMKHRIFAVGVLWPFGVRDGSERSACGEVIHCFFPGTVLVES